MPSVKIIIDKVGNVEMDYMGFQGQTCKIAEKNIMERIKNLRMTSTQQEDKLHEDEMMELRHE